MSVTIGSHQGVQPRSAVWALGLATASAIVMWIVYGNVLATLAAGSVVAAVASLISSGRMLRRLAPLHSDMAQLSRDLARDEMFSAAQNSLDRNLALLRDKLYGHGEPRRVGDQLYFGKTLVNGDFTAVDSVRDREGCTATVFLGDLRISTNVSRPDGERATGTRLAAGAVYDAVLGAGHRYRGEADILGVSYFTSYEPIISGGEVIGVLYVGVKKADFAERLQRLEAKSTAKLDPVTGIMQAAATLRQATQAQAQAERDAIQGRLASDNMRCRQERARQVAAVQQRTVVETLSHALEGFAAGDLSQSVETVFPPEYEKLRSDFNLATRALRETVGGISAGCDTIRGGAREISHAADDLARRTERQAATLEQTAAALDQVTVSVRKTAEGADQASRLVASARQSAQRGEAVVGESVAAMARIEDSSHQIGQIVGLIDSIAFQTNLLALNAGVEAARAGDAGRGFAVVAAEVRTLAQRSADAAKEIKGLIKASVQQVESGSAVVTQTSRTLGAIAAEVMEIDRVVLQIAGSAQEQARTLDQVNVALNDMDQVTQQNAAMVEQSTAASHELARQVEELARSVARFRLSPETRGRPLRRAA
jgi:methyl-accepting chemotaxis protein